MTLLISRSTIVGDPRLTRAPFAEPGPQPQIRASALSFQGLDGESAASVSSAEGSVVLTNGTGDVSTYRIPQNTGVPGYRFNPTNNPLAVGNKSRPTLYIGGSANRPPISSMMTVFRVFSPSNKLPEADGSKTVHDYMHLIKPHTLGSSTIFFTGINDGGYPAMTLLASGGTGSSGFFGGNVVAADGRLHTAALTINGGVGNLYLDGSLIATKTGINALGSNGLTLGFSYSGGDMDTVEAGTYEAELTAAQVKEKHKHYEALYQFKA